MADKAENTDWPIKRLLEWTTEYLKKTQVDQPRLSAEILLAHVLDWQRLDLYTRFNHYPDPDQLTTFRELVKRCAAQEPVRYLTGSAHFYSLEFCVSPAVLIPRPETETLVTEALDFLRRQTTRPIADVLDLCTGSGCVAIALAASAVEAEVVAVDNSPAALEIAQKNVEKHKLQPRITLLQSDLFAQMDKSPKGLFDLIVGNPPYIATAEYEKLPRVIRDYEPPSALLAGPDGLDIIRRIVSEAQPFLAESGALMLEIAYNQAFLAPLILICPRSRFPP